MKPQATRSLVLNRYSTEKELYRRKTPVLKFEAGAVDPPAS